MSKSSLLIAMVFVVAAAALAFVWLPADAGERDDYVLGLTTTLARDFDVADAAPAGPSSPRRHDVLPWYIWLLGVPPSLAGG
jgi:hypothetical protein